jgi:hypothetical protein
MPDVQFSGPWHRPILSQPQSTFAHTLELDGFAIAGGTLRRTLPQEMRLPEAESELVQLLKKHAFITAHGHLDNALSAYTSGAWAGANADLDKVRYQAKRIESWAISNFY